jgi:hypothetical protein
MCAVVSNAIGVVGVPPDESLATAVPVKFTNLTAARAFRFGLSTRFLLSPPYHMVTRSIYH